MFGKFRRRKSETGASPEELASTTTGSLALQLLQGNWRCSKCDQIHHGLMDLAARAPDPWPHERTFEPNSALRLADDFLSEDFCVIDGKHFFVRAILEIPLVGLPEPWAFGCWTTLPRPNFDKYVAAFDTGDYEDMGPWFGWLCNHLKGYFEGDPEAVDVYPQAARKRPKLVVKDPDHPLARAQAEGITPDAMLELLTTYGHGPTAQ